MLKMFSERANTLRRGSPVPFTLIGGPLRPPLTSYTQIPPGLVRRKVSLIDLINLMVFLPNFRDAETLSMGLV